MTVMVYYVSLCVYRKVKLKPIRIMHYLRAASDHIAFSSADNGHKL